MKIDASSSSSRPELTPRRLEPRDAAPAEPRTEPNADAIEISDEGRRVLEFPKDAGTRADLVSRLRREVDAGTYKPDADAVARRLVERTNS